MIKSRKSNIIQSKILYKRIDYLFSHSENMYLHLNLSPGY